MTRIALGSPLRMGRSDALRTILKSLLDGGEKPHHICTLSLDSSFAASCPDMIAQLRSIGISVCEYTPQPDEEELVACRTVDLSEVLT